jgi:hypothetical protein
MKTKVNQMVLTAIFAFIIISGNVNATEKEAIVVSGLEIIAETKLELENWMVNDTYWVRSATEHVLEENLILEAWMIDEDNWNVPATEQILVEAEKQLMLENWMTSNSFWN